MMIRRSDYFEKIDRYLNQEMGESELRDFQAELSCNAELAEELEFQTEVERAVCEEDVAGLRRNLQALFAEGDTDLGDAGSVVAEYFSFNLPEEVSSLKGFGGMVNTEGLLNFAQCMPRLHLYRHEKALNENIHPFYKEQEGAGSSVGDEYALSPGDQLILDDLQKALEEKDIVVLRDNLSRIASGMPDHQWSFGQIDAYLDNDLEDIPDFAGELAANASLARDVDFVQQVSMAVSEQDIMELRASLEQVRQEALSPVYETGQLDDYITGDMDPTEIAFFESELALNPGLAAELALYREVDSACGEKDIMALRESLQHLSAETGKPVEYSFAGRLRRSKLVIPAIAASLALLLALSNLIGRSPDSANDIYKAYYSVYQPAGVFRSVDAGNEMRLALEKFNEKDYQGALDLLIRVAPSAQENPAMRFYTGMSRQQLGKYPEALVDYQAVIENKDNLFVEQARWYTGLCLLQTGERKKAVRLFRQIRDEKGYYAGQAGEILGKLED